MTKEEQIKKIYDFIHNEHVCVISTVSPECKSEAATMGFSETEDLKLFFQTPNDTRKYQNLKSNQNVAIVIGWDLETFITIQYEGIASEVEDNEIDRVRNIHIAKNEASKKYAYLPENRYFIVAPKWIRYWDVKGNDKFEVTF